MPKKSGSTSHTERAQQRAGLYLRISTDEKNQPWSLGSQEELGTAYCLSQGWPIAAVYRDEASGATLDRPALQQALADAEAGRIDVLVFYRIDRLSRDLHQLLSIEERLHEVDAALASVTEPFDTTTHIGRMIMQVLGAIAQFERGVIVDRITRGVERRVQAGKHIGKLPTGMMLGEDRIPCADTDWLPLAIRVFEMYANDRLGSTVISRVLNAEGLRTKKGNRWTTQAILRILHSPAFVGMQRYKGELVPSEVKPVIDINLWERAQKILEERGEHEYLRRGNTSDYLLSGIPRCSKCNSPYVGKSANGNGGTYHYYACQGRIKQGKDFCDSDHLPRHALETAVILDLVELLAVSGLPEAAWDKAKEAQASGKDKRLVEIQRLGRQIADKEAARSRYFAAFESGDLEPAECRDRVDPIKAELASLRMRREMLESAVAIRDAAFPFQAVDSCLEAFEEMDERSPESIKALLRILVKKIVVGGPDDIRCTYRLPVRLDGEPVRPMDGRVHS